MQNITRKENSQAVIITNKTETVLISMTVSYSE